MDQVADNQDHALRPTTTVPTPRTPERLSVPLVYILPFTHEDASWFARHADVRRHNQRVLDRVVSKALADRDLRYTAEAAWIVDDYLSSATAQRRREVAEIHGRGQLEIGPFYALLDDRLAGERARIYNVLIGRRILRDQHELEPAAIGIFNDIFGLDRQTPQVLRKLGIDTLLYTRGDVPETRGSILNRWEAPDGKSWVYAVRQIGYCTGDRLGHGEVEATATPYRRPLINPPEIRAPEAVRRLKEYDRSFAAPYAAAGLEVYALFNGADYEPLQEDIGEVLVDLARAFPHTAFALGRFGDYAALAGELPPASLPTYVGDLFGDGAAPIRGADATNIPYVKAPYELMDRLLYEAEALWAVAAKRTAMVDARPYLTDTWRKALIVATHDAICATVAQTVLQEVAQEIRQVQLMAGRIRKEAMGYLATGLEMRYNDNRLVDDAYSVLNLSSHSRREPVFLPIPAELCAESSLVATLEGDPLPVQVIDREEGLFAACVAEVEGFSARQVRLGWTLTPFPSPTCGRGELSGTDKEVRSSGSPSPAMRDRGLGGEGCFAENEFLRVWAEGGAIHFQDRRNPNHATSLWFDLFRDRGDTYTVDPIEQSPWNSKHDERLATQDTVVERGPILEELQVEMVAELPAELDETRKGVTALLQRLSITTRVRLAAGIGRADLDVTVDNPGIKDYVLRAVVGVTETDGAVRARDNFFMQEHGPLDPVGLSWFERLKDHDYTTNLLAVGSVALYSKGLHAYNAERRGDCTDTALVLQRGVGYISRSDLAARPVPAAAQVEVPMAQCLGRHTVQLGISLDAAGKTANELARMADDFRYGLIVGPQGIDLRGVPQLGGDVVVLGVKEAEDRQGTIYHVMNYGGTEVEVAFDRAVQPCLLDETADPARPRRTRFLALGPHQIAAVRIE